MIATQKVVQTTVTIAINTRSIGGVKITHTVSMPSAPRVQNIKLL